MTAEGPAPNLRLELPPSVPPAGELDLTVVRSGLRLAGGVVADAHVGVEAGCLNMWALLAAPCVSVDAHQPDVRLEAQRHQHSSPHPSQRAARTLRRAV